MIPPETLTNPDRTAVEVHQNQQTVWDAGLSTRLQEATRWSRNNLTSENIREQARILSNAIRYFRSPQRVGRDFLEICRSHRHMNISDYITGNLFLLGVSSMLWGLGYITFQQGFKNNEIVAMKRATKLALGSVFALMTGYLVRELYAKFRAADQERQLNAARDSQVVPAVAQMTQIAETKEEKTVDLEAARQAPLEIEESLDSTLPEVAEAKETKEADTIAIEAPRDPEVALDSGAMLPEIAEAKEANAEETLSPLQRRWGQPTVVLIQDAKGIVSNRTTTQSQGKKSAKVHPKPTKQVS